MWESDLTELEAFKKDLRKRMLALVTCKDLADAIDCVLRLFILSEHELTALSECVDDLALHTGHQLKKEAEEAANG